MLRNQNLCFDSVKGVGKLFWYVDEYVSAKHWCECDTVLSQIAWSFVQLLAWANNKWNIKALFYLAFVGESTGHRWIQLTIGLYHGKRIHGIM